MTTTTTTTVRRASAIASLLLLIVAALAVVLPTALGDTPASAATVAAAEGPEADLVPTCRVIQEAGPGCPGQTGDCWWTGCVGKDADNQNCTGVNTEEKWIPGIQATLRIRSASNCASRWARLHWLESGGACAMSGVAIQHRRKVDGEWKTGAVQDATRGINGFCPSGAFWTKMVLGSSADYRYRTANGYMASGCTSDCVRFNWSSWSAWK